MKPKDKPHYVNNRDFSNSVVEYVKTVREAQECDDTIPKVPDYIAISFLKIAEGLSHKSNFIRYTYREEMVMDGVENCLKAILNYNLEAATRSGNPNAFAYFTQICWYAFLRRIAKEKKQQDIKLKYISQSDTETFLENPNGDSVSKSSTLYFIDMLKGRIDKVKEFDSEVKQYAKKEKAKRKRNTSPTDSDLSEFLED